MTWGAVGGAAASAVIGGMMSKDSGGGTQTASKEPWAPAVPWITSNLNRGQSLQSQYEANPFNAIQQAAYANLLGGNDYISQMAPGLLSQFSQSQGFDRNNPRAKPQAIQFPAMNLGYQPTQGLLAGSMGQATASAPVAAAPAQQYVTGLFGTVPAPVQVPGVTTPALPPTTWADWQAGLANGGGY